MLAGWNVGLVSAFLSGIGLIFVFGGDGGISDRWAIAMIASASILVGIAVGYVITRQVARWFANQKFTASLGWLFLLALVTLLSFPAPLRFGM